MILPRSPACLFRVPGDRASVPKSPPNLARGRSTSRLACAVWLMCHPEEELSPLLGLGSDLNPGLDCHSRLAFKSYGKGLVSRNEKEEKGPPGTGIGLRSEVTWPMGRKEHSVPTLELLGPSSTTVSSLAVINLPKATTL